MNGAQNVAMEEERYCSSQTASGTVVETKAGERTYCELSLKVGIEDSKICKGSHPDYHFQTDAPVEDPQYSTKQCTNPIHLSLSCKCSERRY